MPTPPLARAFVCALALIVSTVAFAQQYPNRTVRVIIPFPPGGTLDALGRGVAQKLAEQLGQPFVVENRPGGNGIIGADAVAKANPDGYTLLFNASTFVTAPMTMKSVPYGIVKDFTPIALVAKAPLSVAVGKKVPNTVTDVKSLVAYAKANPGRVTFAVGSVGSAGHLSTELLKRTTGMDYVVVPYKGTAPAFQDLIGGQIDAFIDPILGALQYHRSGLLRVIAVTSAARAPSLPDVPTVAETLPGYEFYSWYGIWGPANLSAELTQRLNSETNKALAAADLRDKFVSQGLLFTPGTVDDFVKFQREDMAKAQKVITDAGIRLE